MDFNYVALNARVTTYIDASLNYNISFRICYYLSQIIVILFNIVFNNATNFLQLKIVIDVFS